MKWLTLNFMIAINFTKMKKIRVFVLSATAFVIVVCSVFVSCQKEVKYSCDEKIDQKVKKNRSSNQSITRYELAHLEDLDYQMGVFLSLTPENKVRIFNEKVIAEQNNPHLNTNEKAILYQMITYLQPAHYTTLNNEFKIFSHEREIILRNIHGWDNAKVYIFTNSWLLESEIIDYIAMKASGGSHGGGGANPPKSNDCTCYYGYYCWIKGGGSGSCVTGSCNKPNGGCGIFGTTNCDGKCE